MNFWRQTTHIMSYFKEESFRGDKRLPKDFMSGFLEVSLLNQTLRNLRTIDCSCFISRDGTKKEGLSKQIQPLCMYIR